MNKLFVVSLGGSLIAPDSIDREFLTQFKKIISRNVALGHRFILVSGGGAVSRSYTDALKEISKNKIALSHLDWMGIYATRLNAKFIQLVFEDIAYKDVIIDPDKKVPFRRGVLLAGGSKPGHSTDNVAMHLARTYGADTVINLTNIDFLYTKDPRNNPDAEPIERISWANYRRMIGNQWDPGGHFPFDPIASKFAQAHKQKVLLVSGHHLENFENIIRGRKFKGTTIE